MADANGPTPDHLSFLSGAKADAKRFGFLALLRKAEARAPGRPRIGRSRLPAQNIVDLAHEPSMEFPASTIAVIEPGGPGRFRVRGLFLGLTGPMGALPLHLTEYAFYERRTSQLRPFGRWLDVITDRMLQFFYRAWADSQPAAQADRTGDDGFAAQLGALCGLGLVANQRLSAPDRVLKREDFLRYAGLMTSRRSASTMEDGLSHLLRTPVEVTEFVVRWRDIEPNERTRLGGARGYNQLGLDAVMGSRICIAEDTFRVTIKADSFETYKSFLPGHQKHKMAGEMLDMLKPTQLSWELQLSLDEGAAPGARLNGETPLGFSSWLAPSGKSGLRVDARIRGS